MIKLIQTRPESRDCTAPYDVKFDKPYTIGELVNEVLTTRSNEWGDFGVREGGSWFKPTTVAWITDMVNLWANCPKILLNYQS